MRTKQKLSLLEICDDFYLFTLRGLLDDHRISLDWFLRQLEDFDSRGYGGNLIRTNFVGSKVIISDQYDKDSIEWAIEIDRAALIELVKSWEQLLREDAEEVTLFRDDEHITIVGLFDNKPEYRKTVAYRCKGNALNKAEIVIKASMPKHHYATERYLRYLSHLLVEHSNNLKRLLNMLYDSNTEEISGGRIRVEFEKGRAVLLDMDEECPYDNPIKIDRNCLIDIIKAWQNLLDQKATFITLFRNDDYITMIGLFGKDIPEYQERFPYRVRYPL